jgi:glutaryl-CoA dehydrogenase
LVETDAAGFASQDIDNKFSLRASITSALFLDDVRVPNDAMLPNARGMRGPLSCLTQARYGITWGVVGAAQACLAEALDYAAERVLFGRPLAATQAVQIRLADVARRLTSAQLFAHRLGQLKTAGSLTPTQVSIAKWHNVRAALEIARSCRELLGGAGITTEFAAIRHMLNLETVVTYEGTETIHQLVVGKELTGQNAF